jgi:hypothetical protein
MALFADTADLATEFPMLESAAWEHLLPFVELVEQRTMRTVVLGATVYDALHAAYQASIADTPTPVPSPYDALLPKVRKVVAFLTSYEAMPTLNVLYTGQGMVIAETANVKAAPMWRVNQARTQLLLQAYGFMDLLIMHLQSIEASLSAWSSAPLRAEVRGSLIPDMRAAEPYMKLHGPWMLHQMRPYLRDAQTGPVKAMLGTTAYDALLAAVHANPSTLTADQLLQLDVIRPAMLNLAIAEAMEPLSITMDNLGVWTWTMPSSGGQIAGGQQPADNPRMVSLKRQHENKGQRYLEELRTLITPTTATVNTIPGNTGSVFFGG